MSDVQRGPGWWIASDGKWYPPETHPEYRSPPSPPPPVVPFEESVESAPAKQSTTDQRVTARWLFVGAGAALVVGSFMPWVTLTAPFVGSISRSGVEGGGDGIFSLAIGVVVGGIGLASRPWPRRKPALIAGLFSLAAIGLAVFEWLNISGRAGSLDAEVRDAVAVAQGSGLVVIGLAGMAGLLAMVLAMERRR